MPGSPIRNCIRRLRFDHDEMTQEALGEQIGMTRQTVAAIEQGRYSPSLEAAFRIARVFRVGVETVFQWEEDVEPALASPAEGRAARLARRPGR